MGRTGLGTVPHALIAAYGGDTLAAARKFADVGAGRHERDRARRLRQRLRRDGARRRATSSATRLWGVRLDTSESLVDRSLWDELGDFRPTGVNERLVRKVRAALDARRPRAVRIVVSGGFTVDKIREFEAEGCRSTRTASARR